MLVSGHISEQWKSSMIIPISKPEKFNYNMVNVRPIALLDTFRKRTPRPTQTVMDYVSGYSKGRKAQILTSFGLTPSFEAVDQGDSLSLVLWRIYYDPLLNAITKRPRQIIKNLGIWLAEKRARSLNKQRIMGIKEVFLQSVHRKSLSIAHIVYLVNKVLYPKISYLSQTLSLSKKEWENIERPVGLINSLAPPR
ncbi:unnamed protein product [Rhizophagus irregularis]|nr:unnamed protein product [Rhizophagus irregularis]CAB4434098.1 unnamed protein product [Rhizophagus irregularis]